MAVQICAGPRPRALARHVPADADVAPARATSPVPGACFPAVVPIPIEIAVWRDAIDDAVTTRKYTFLGGRSFLHRSETRIPQWPRAHPQQTHHSSRQPRCIRRFHGPKPVAWEWLEQVQLDERGRAALDCELRLLAQMEKKSTKSIRVYTQWLRPTWHPTRIRSASSILPSMTSRSQSLAPEVFHGTAYHASVGMSFAQVAAYRRRMARERFERPRILRKEWAQELQDAARVEQHAE